MEQLAATLMTWIALHSSYPVAKVPIPQIVVMSPAQITAFYRKQIMSDQREPAIDPRIIGYFDRRPGGKGIVYILDPALAPEAKDFNNPLENPRFRERLLHELVHYAQHVTGAYEKFQCPAKAEFDAYMLGGRYLTALGVGDDLDIRVRQAVLFSTC